MLPIDQGDGPGAQPARDTIVPPQAMARGGTIIRPGAVAWGGPRDFRSHASCEAIEHALAAAAADPAELPGLLAELAAARLWVPLPPLWRPCTDGTAVRLPLVSRQGTDFVPCFTSVLRLTAWAREPGARAVGGGAQRAGDVAAAPHATVPHVVVPAAGLAGRVPDGVGLALNPDSVPGMPLYPECLPHLAGLATAGQPGAPVVDNAVVDDAVMDAWVASNARHLYTRD